MKDKTTSSPQAIGFAAQQVAEGIVIAVWAQPGAKKNGFVGVHNGMLKIAVTAPPEDGRANAAIVQLLAKELKLSKSRVVLQSGATQRQKKFLLVGLDSSALQSILLD